MINLTSAQQAIVKDDETVKSFRVHFPNGERSDLTNSDIVFESVKFTESVCSQNVFKFGLSERSQIEFECVGVENIYGVTIECSMTFTLGSDSVTIPYGTFVVESCPRQHGAMKHRKVTAYSIQPLNDYDVFSTFMGTKSPFGNFKLSLSAMNAALGFNSLSVSAVTPSSRGITYGGTFYGSDGHELQISITGSDYYRATIPTPTDFVQLNFETDAEQNEMLGKCIAEMLDNANLNVKCDSSGQQIFPDTESALRAYAPSFFYPAIRYNGYTYSGGTVSNTGNVSYNTPIKSGQLTPIITSDNNGVSSDTSVRLSSLWYSANEFQYMPSVPSVLSVRVYDTTSGTTQNIAYTPTEAFPQKPDFTCTFTSGNAYYQTASESVVFTIKPTLNIENSIFTEPSRKPNTGYSYYNAFSWLKAVDGMLEIMAQFGHYSRAGVFVRKTLGNTPIQIDPSEYSDLWWDDYIIDSIGAVMFKFGDSVTTYYIGSGASIYDMTSNYLLDHYEPSDTADGITAIETLLDTYFVPNVGAVSFIPTDMTMIGMPYLEAGDYLAIDNADGGTVHTYILRRQLTGIQHLEDEIEANGGEIITGVQ